MITTMVIFSHLVHMVTDLFSKDRIDSLARFGIRLSRFVQVIGVPHVENTCPHASRLLLGDGLLGDAHLILDGVDGIGEHPAGLALHIVEPPVEEVANVDRDVEVRHLTVLGKCVPSL